MNGFELIEKARPPGLELAKKSIEDLYSKYADDPTIFAKMHNYVCFRLPTVIDEMKRSSEERRIRNDILSTEQDAFICSFLNDHQYFYCPQTDLYFYYDGIRYVTKREDDVLHHILTSITKDCNTLIPRKPQTKVYIMKRIKESNPLKSIPESFTIQAVLDALYPAMFSTKSAAKYFLAILGDHLLKKGDDSTHAYFTSPKAKEFLREVGTISQSLFGQNAVSLFKYKYHSHAFKTLRLVQMNDSVGVESLWRPIMQLKAIDILCVAAHYSGRYESADQYLETYSDDADLAKYATHFRWRTGKEVVADFAGEYLRTSPDPNAAAIAAPTMEYLWKRYLKDHKFPAVLGTQAFLQTMIDHFPDKYDASTNYFRGLSSLHTAVVERFQRFWQECIVLVDKPDPLAEYEVDELVMMYRESFNGLGETQRITESQRITETQRITESQRITETQRITESQRITETQRITDSQMLDLIRFYEDVEVIDNKFVQGVKSPLWDKQADLKLFFTELQRIAEVDYTESMSFYEAYSIYQRFCRDKGRQTDDAGSKRKIVQMVSKNYFEKYIYDAFGNDGVVDGKIIFS